MKFFADTANVEELAELSKFGLLDGVTTNPSLIASSGRDIKEVLAEICNLTDGPVSAEVVATDSESMLREADVLRSIAPNIAVKVPMTWDGLDVCRRLTDDGTMVNVTLCFSAAQALLAARANATFISPFVGRLDDIGAQGMNLIGDILEIYSNYGYDTEVLVASVRSVDHLLQAASLGADIVTAPAKILKALISHPLTDRGLEDFLADWAKTKQSIH